MRRTVAVITALLVAGAVINVAVAWGLLLRGKNTEFQQLAMSTSGGKTIPFDTSVFFQADDAFIGKYDLFAWKFRGLGIRTLRVSHWIGYNAAADDTGDYLVERTCGWPMLAFEGSCRELSKLSWAVPVPSEWNRNQPFRTAGKPVAREFLPFKPIWPGFAINTLFYAAILWMLFVAPFAIRRRFRLKRGRCVKCAYDLRGGGRADEPSSGVCPECGTATR